MNINNVGQQNPNFEARMRGNVQLLDRQSYERIRTTIDKIGTSKDVVHINIPKNESGEIKIAAYIADKYEQFVAPMKDNELINNLTTALNTLLKSVFGTSFSPIYMEEANPALDANFYPEKIKNLSLFETSKLGLPGHYSSWMGGYHNREKLAIQNFLNYNTGIVTSVKSRNDIPEIITYSHLNQPDKKIKEIFCQKDGTPFNVSEYDLESGKISRSIFHCFSREGDMADEYIDGIRYHSEYDENGTLKSITEHNDDYVCSEIRSIQFQKDGITPIYMREYDRRNNSYVRKSTFYQNDGITPQSIVINDFSTKVKQEILYGEDGKTIISDIKYNIETNEPILN